MKNHKEEMETIVLKGPDEAQELDMEALDQVAGGRGYTYYYKEQASATGEAGYAVLVPTYPQATEMWIPSAEWADFQAANTDDTDHWVHAESWKKKREGFPSLKRDVFYVKVKHGVR